MNHNIWAQISYKAHSRRRGGGAEGGGGHCAPQKTIVGRIRAKIRAKSKETKIKKRQKIIRANSRVLSLVTHFLDTLVSHSLCTQGLFHETVSVIGFLASEYSLAI